MSETNAENDKPMITENITNLLLDLDGCLSGGKGTYFDLPKIQRVKEMLHNAPFKTSICTGRSAAYVEVMAQMLEITEWCICENGAYLFHPFTEQFIYHPNISALEKQRLQTLKNELQSRQNVPNDALADISIEYGKELCVSLNHPTWTIKALYQVVIDEMNTEGLYLCPAATALDITPKDIDKGSGVHFLSDKLGIPLEHFAAIGDSNGDVPTFELVGARACPSNANDAIKSLSDYIAKSSEVEGAIDCLTWLCRH